MFRDYRVVLVGDDSSDATLEFLADWRTSNPRVEILRGSIASRRNGYRDRVVAEHADFDHAIVIDTSVPGGWSFNGVASTFGEEGWDFVGSNGLVRLPTVKHAAPRFRQYDVRAFRPAAGTEASSLDERAEWPQKRGMPMLPVDSCFGGLGVYRMECLRACSYGDGDCEHAVFHDRLRQSGLGRLFLNPSQIVLYSPD